ncbi:MAG: SpoVA/SpoVAEb family sporulation membrane protein [Bacilli bacterium]|nr:SpoVA/SpoVAEb family sporulation membrane protein [Bacilli bacterium]
MRNTKYERIANEHKADENRIGNAIIAFISGGVIGMLGEIIIEVLLGFGINRTEAIPIMIVIFIFIASLGTALGFFDNLVTKFKCGLLIPITGFAHAMTSSCLDYKNEGPIYGLGSNMFKLTGSVILYGIVSAYIFGTIRYIIGGM